MPTVDSNTFSVSIVASVPAWVSTAISAGWSVGRWAKVSGPGTLSYGLTNETPGTDEGTTLYNAKSVNQNSVDFQGIIASWCSGCVVPGFRNYGGLAIHGGGHGTGSGNDLYIYDFERRLWVEVWPDSSGVGGSGSSDGEYGDGSIISNHWRGHLARAGDDHVFFSKGFNSNSGGSDSSTVARGHLYNVAGYEASGQVAANWIQAANGLTPNGSLVPLQEGAIAYDPVGGRVWMFSHNPGQGSRGIWASIDPLTESAWTNHDVNAGGAASASPRLWNSGWNSKEVCADIDPDRRIFLISDYAQNRFRAMDLANPSDYNADNQYSWIVTPSGSVSIQNTGSIYWCAALDAFVTWKLGSNSVYKYAYVSGDAPSNYTLSGSNILDAGNTVSLPTTNGAGTATSPFRQAAVVEWGSTALLFVTLDVTGNTYAFRLA